MIIGTVPFKPGDKVRIDHPREAGRIFTVVKVNPRTVRVSDASGRTVLADAMLLRAVTDTDAATVTELPIDPIYFPGQTVTLRGKPGVYVVLKSTPRGYSCAMLGGDGGRYWNCPASSLVAVTGTFTETA